MEHVKNRVAGDTSLIHGSVDSSLRAKKLGSLGTGGFDKTFTYGGETVNGTKRFQDSATSLYGEKEKTLGDNTINNVSYYNKSWYGATNKGGQRDDKAQVALIMSPTTISRTGFLDENLKPWSGGSGGTLEGTFVGAQRHGGGKNPWNQKPKKTKTVGMTNSVSSGYHIIRLFL